MLCLQEMVRHPSWDKKKIDDTATGSICPPLPFLWLCLYVSIVVGFKHFCNVHIKRNRESKKRLVVITANIRFYLDALVTENPALILYSYIPPFLSPPLKWQHSALRVYFSFFLSKMEIIS